MIENQILTEADLFVTSTSAQKICESFEKVELFLSDDPFGRESTEADLFAWQPLNPILDEDTTFEAFITELKIEDNRFVL
jgi:hypothetical protein